MAGPVGHAHSHSPSPSTKQSHVKTRRWEACFTDSAKQVATASVISQLARLLAWLLACSLARAHKQTSSSCSLFGSVLPSFPTSAAPFVINHDLVLVGGQRRWVEGSTTADHHRAGEHTGGDATAVVSHHRRVARFEK